MLFLYLFNIYGKLTRQNQVIFTLIVYINLCRQMMKEKLTVKGTNYGDPINFLEGSIEENFSMNK